MWTAVASISFVALLVFSIKAVYGLLKKTGRFSQNIMYAGLCCVFAIFCLKVAPEVNWYPSKQRNNVLKQLDAYEKSRVGIGEEGILNEDTFVSLGEDKENFTIMQAYITTNNEAGLKRMMKLGKVYLAVKGTGITVISKGFALAKVEISSTGRIGWVPTVYISKE